MVLHHVAQRTRLIVVTAAPLNAEGFGHGDLDVVDILLVPERLEDFVGEAQRQNVLDGFFAEVMVDPKHLPLLEHIRKNTVQLARGFEAAPERFFDDDARVPVLV